MPGLDRTVWAPTQKEKRGVKKADWIRVGDTGAKFLCVKTPRGKGGKTAWEGTPSRVRESSKKEMIHEN